MKKNLYTYILLFLSATNLLYAQEVQNNADAGPGSLRELIENETFPEITIPAQMAITLESAITINRDLIIKGGEGTTIQVTNPGTSKYRLFEVQNAPDELVLENLILKGGSLTRPQKGGAIYISSDNTRLTLNNVVAEGTKAIEGGAIYTEGSIDANESTFRNNSYQEYDINESKMAYAHGGALYVGGDLTLTDCLFEGNYIDLSYKRYIRPSAEWENMIFKGGAVCCEGDAQMIRTTFNNNYFKLNSGWAYFHRYIYGGALYVGGNVTASDIFFESNYIDCEEENQETGLLGGALAVMGDIEAESDLNFINNEIRVKRNAETYPTRGGAIYVNGSITAIKGAHLFEGNKAGDHQENYTGLNAGAIYIEEGEKTCSIHNAQFIRSGATTGGAIYAGEKITLNIDNVLFEGNRAYYLLINSNTPMGYGGAIFIGGLSQLNITNSQFYKNESGNEGGAIFSFGKLFMESCEVGNPDDENSGNISKNKGGLSVTCPRGDAEVILKDTKICYNQSINPSSGGYLGGAFFSFYNSVENVTIDISDCLFKGNQSVNGRAGGLQIAGGSDTSKPSVKVTQCTFTENSSAKEGSALYIDSYANMASGITAIIKDCTFDTNKTGDIGTAYVYKADEITFQGETTFSNNQAKDAGSGIYFDNVKKANVEKGTVFTANSAERAAGIFSFKSNTNIDGCEFIDHIITGYGSAIYNHTGVMKITNSLFKDNETTDTGGAVYSYLETIEIDSCVFRNNKAVYGGAIANRSDMKISNCVVENGEASEYGGGIMNTSNLFIINTEISNNKAKNGGGGFYNTGEASLTNVLLAENEVSNGGGGAIFTWSKSLTPLVLTNVTIVKNTSKSYGGALYNYTNNATNMITNIRNSIFWDNRSVDAPAYNEIVLFSGTNVSYEYSLIKGTTQDDTNHNIAGSIENTPLFLGDLATNGTPYYSLLPQSPGVEKGNNDYFSEPELSSYTSDLAGNERIQRNIDMGAYELSGSFANFVADGNAVCEGSSGSLSVNLYGTGPWELFYKVNDSESERKITIKPENVENGLFSWNGLHPGTYTLTKITEDGKEGAILPQVSASIGSVSLPTVSEISGPNEVLVDSVITLTNATSGGTWLVNNSQIATIDLRGRLTGIAQGVVEVWYVVTGSDPTNCETIVIHSVQVKTAGGGGQDPDPEDPDPEDPDPEDPDPVWPPVVPEPEPEPDPDPDAWIIIRPGTEACFSDDFFNVAFRLQYTLKPLKYAVAFTEASKAAGFEDVKTYKALPDDGIVSIAIPKGIRPGTYSGYLLLRENGSQEYKMYPFSVKIKDNIRIIEQPESITLQGNGEIFSLSVKAQGDNLTYQWFHNGERLAGATASTYETMYDTMKEGLYYVEIYGDCGWIQSDEATVTGCFGILIKWDDVLYVQNTDGRYVGFQWYHNGEPIGTYGTSIYYTDPQGMYGLYHVRAYKADGTYDQSCPVDFITTTRSSSLSIYPTVVERNHYINVESDELGGSYIGGIVEIYNLSGGKVYSQRLHSPILRVPLNQPAGIYILLVTAPDGRRKTEKILVK